MDKELGGDGEGGGSRGARGTRRPVRAASNAAGVVIRGVSSGPALPLKQAGFQRPRECIIIVVVVAALA